MNENKKTRLCRSAWFSRQYMLGQLYFLEHVEGIDLVLRISGSG
jgi:hypothetical protein